MSARLVLYFSVIISCIINNIVTISLSMNSKAITLRKISCIRKELFVILFIFSIGEVKIRLW